MKFYVTGRSSNYPLVQSTFAEIKARGHEVVFEWTDLPMIKPYAENQTRAADYSEQGIQGVVDADVYILFADREGNGVFTELGAALASHTIKGSPRIFAINEANQDGCMFHYHPAISWKKSLEELFAEIKPI